MKANHGNNTHILHIASGDLWAGAEVMLFTLAKALNELPDIQVSSVILNHGKLEQKLRDSGIPVIVLDESRLNSLQILRQLKVIIRDMNPDVVHTHRNKENFLGGLAARLNNVPSLRTVHGAPEHRPPLHQLPKHLIRFLDWFSGRFFQQHIVAVSPDLAHTLEQSFSAEKIRTIENGIDIDSITKNLLPGENQSGFKIGIAGRLVTVKRVDLFIQTAHYLKQHNPELSIQFHIYGDGPLHDALQTQLRSLQAENYIHLEGNCENIAKELTTLDALLMPSDHEGLPMILLEAMCLKTAIIAHAVGGIPQLLDKGRCGTLVYQQTPEAFANAITELFAEPERFQKLSQQAFEHVQQKYSVQHTATAYLKVYNEITN